MSVSPRVVVFVAVAAVLAVAGYALWSRSESEPDPNSGTNFPTTPYHGRLVDHLRRPVPGVSVAAIQVPPGFDGRSQSRSSRDGSFRIDLPDGFHPRVRFSKKGFVNEEIELVPTDGDAAAPGYVLVRGAQFSARVTDHLGQPVTRAPVDVRGHGGWTTEVHTDDGGQFELTAPEGPLVLTLHSSRRPDPTWSVNKIDRQRPTHREFALDEDPGTVLQVRVLEPDRPSRGARVLIRTDTGDREEAVTDAEGLATAAGLGGRVIEFAVVKPGFATVVDHLERDPAAPVVERNVALEPAMPYTLDVVDADGRAVSAARVSVARRSHRLIDFELGDEQRGNILGPDAPFQFTIEAPGYPSRVVTHTVRRAEETLEVRIVPGCRITAKAIDTNGESVGGALFFVMRVDRSSPQLEFEARGFTTESGSFRSPLLVPGSVHVHLQHPTAGSWNRRVEIEGDTDLGAVTLQK